MFKELMQIIANQVAGFTPTKDGNNVARNLIILASPSMEKVRDMVQEKYPPLSELDEFFRVWIGGNNIDTQIDGALRHFLDAGEVARRAGAGYTIQDRIGQIIILVDVLETDSDKKLLNILDSVAFLLKKYTADNYFLVSIVCILPYNVDRKAAKPSILAAMDDKYREIVSRVFLIDNDNRHGASLINENDRVSLAGQLVGFLLRFAIIAEVQKYNGEGYAAWLKRELDMRLVTGFSAYTSRMPMEEILNLACVYKGSEILEEIFLGSDEIGAHIYYDSNYSKTTNTMSREDLYAAVLREYNKTLQNPTAKIPKFDRFAPESYFNSVKEIYNGLEDAADKNQEILADSYEKKHAKNIIAFEDHVESIMIQEMHGFSVAGKFNEAVSEKIKGLITEELPNPAKGSIDEDIINDIRDYLLKMPSRESIALRLFVLLIACMTGLAVLPFSAWHKITGLFLLPTIALAAGIIWVKMSERILENKVIKLESHINKKWKDLTVWHRDKAINALSKRLVEYVETIKNELKSAQTRLTSVINYFREEYMPEAPSDSAFWMTQLTKREDLLSYKDKCQIDVLAIAKTLFIEQRPQFLWRRLANSDTSEPNNMEQYLLESAALRVLPICQSLMLNDVISFMKSPSHADYFKSYILTLQHIHHPFLKTKPGEPENYAYMLESVTAGSDFIVDGLKKYGGIKTIESQQPYLLSFYCFWNDIPLDKILWE